MSKAKIISGPEPQQIWMWGMISKFVYKVKLGDRVIQLNVQIQELKPIPGTEFRQYSFKGYDELTGLKISSVHVKWDCHLGPQGIINISKRVANATELAHKFGPGGKRERKNPLPPIRSKFKTT